LNPTILRQAQPSRSSSALAALPRRSPPLPRERFFHGSSAVLGAMPPLRRPLEHYDVLARAAVAEARPSVHIPSPRQRVRSPVSLFSLVANVRADLEAIGQAAAGGRILTGDRVWGYARLFTF